MDLLNASGYASESSNGSSDSKDETISSPAPINTNNSTNNKGKATFKRPNMNIKAAPIPSILATVQHNHTLDTLHAKKANSHNANANNKGGMMMLMNNPLKSHLLTPTLGPATLDPHGSSHQQKQKSILDESHISSNVAFSHASFEEQRNAFQRTGVARAPDEVGSMIERGNYGHTRRRRNKDTNRWEIVSEEVYQKEIRDKRKAWAYNDDTNETNVANANVHKNSNSRANKRKRKKEELMNDSDDEINYGIWGPPTTEERERQEANRTDLQRAGGIVSSLPEEMIAERAYLAERDRQKGITSGGDGVDEDGNVVSVSRENQDFDKLVERKMAHLLPPRIHGEDAHAIEPTTIFHAKGDEFDYKGSSWITPPSEFKERAYFGDVEHHTCYVPKKVVGRFMGHNKGVHRIRLFPGTGHLLLSAGLDGKCKVWSVHTQKVMRTYIGHSAAVRDVQFNHDGSKFLSCSFDRFIRLWNTETGIVEGTYTNRRVPYVIQFYPKDDTIFVVGCSDNKIVAYDTASGNIVQEYNHHLAPVNTITFVNDHGMKMITSSDDKKVLVWEWDIGVPIKYISDPTMHSMPCIALHPSLAYFAGQSLDNKIAVFAARDRFNVQKKKKFAGHQVAGYACELTISPDGQFLGSGDGNGKFWVWEWKRGKVLQKYRAHEKGPCVGCVWHPVLPSVVFTCGWDGVIKMWQ